MAAGAAAGARAGELGPAPVGKPRLISAATTVATAGEFPWNPMKDAALDDSKLSKDIKWGFQIFTDTPG
ncbi:MAG: hypothetical protein EXS38_07210 [Opitutus sp.]|nr:hypothetical protein [Opitutus sp.]